MADTFNFGSGDFAKPDNINLTDPNELALTGLTAAQRTTPQYQPVLNRSGTGSESAEALKNYQIEGYYPQDYKDQHPELQFQYNPIQDSQGATLGVNYSGINPTEQGTQAERATASNEFNYHPYQETTKAQANTVDGSQDFVGGVTYDAAQSGIAQGVLSSESLVDEQYKRLTEGVTSGQIPDWALTAVTAARQQMNALGLGASTMAGGATAGAILNAALPIAQQNAQTAANLTLANLSARVQTILSNTGMTNAARQFNATSQNQANEFFLSQLHQLRAQNADRLTAISQFNATSENQNKQFYASEYNKQQENRAARQTQVSEVNAQQENAMRQFRDNLASQREEFNTQNGLLIDQSNVQWRRTLNTANTAGQNAANQANVQNLFNLTQTAQNQLWQQARDEASWALTSGENSQNRLLSLVSSALNRQTSLQILASQLNANTFSQLGGLAANLLGGSGISNLASKIFGGSDSNSNTIGTADANTGNFDISGGGDTFGDFGNGIDFGGGGDLLGGIFG